MTKPCATDMEKKGEQYHIGLKKGELADNIIFCGEIERTERVAAFFDTIELRRRRREFITITGKYKGMAVSVMGTGIGPGNTEIAVIESMRIINKGKAIFIRVGSCGSLQDYIKLGDIIISTAAVRFENTSTFFVPDGFPAVANYKVVNAFVQSARKLMTRFHVGLTATTPSFYGAQCRNVGFHLMFPNLINDLTKMGVLNLEMEASTLFILSSLQNIKSGAICAAYTDRIHDTVIGTKDKQKADNYCIRTALDALQNLQ